MFGLHVLNVDNLPPPSSLKMHCPWVLFQFATSLYYVCSIMIAVLVFAGVWKLPGVEVCSKKSESVSSSQGQTIELNGFKFEIHEGSLPEGSKVHIQASIAGEYEIPENSSLVSAIYWVRCEPESAITKPITVEIQHCSTREDVSKLKIVGAVSSQEHGSYKFKPFVGGRFDAHTSYGAIEVNDFSGYGVIEEGNSESKRVYYCQPFYRPLSLQQRHEICIIFIWNTEAHIDVRYL